jgi:integrase
LPDIVLTETRIAALPLPAEGETNYRDPGVPGLGVRCRPGSKTYVVRYRLGGRASPSVRLTLGAAGSGGIPLGEAKKIAARIAADVAHGRDPLAEKKAAIEAAKIAERRMTLGDLLAAHERELRVRGVVSVDNVVRFLKRDCIDVLGAGRDPASITRQELVRLMDRVRDGAPGCAKPRPGSVSTFKARVHGLFEEALRRGVVNMNPLAGHRAPRRSRAERIEAVKRRTGRALDMNEVAALWRACEDPEVNPTFGLYIRMLLITGARRAELAAARKSWLKTATPSHPPLLVFPAESVKNGTEHVVPLPQLAVNVLSCVQRRGSSDLLFPGGTSRSTGRPASISGWSKLIQPLRKAAAAKTWTLHDLRRTARSAWPTLGVDERTCEALLNHTPGDALLAAYDRRDFLIEKAQALELWAAAIENAIAGPGEPADGHRPSAGVLARPEKAVGRANMQPAASPVSGSAS